MADARTHRPQGGLTLPGGHRATLPTVGYPGIDCIAQNSTYAGGIPPWFAHGRRKLRVTEPFGDAIKLSLSRLNHRLPWGQAHPEVVQGTTEFHHEIADPVFPQPDPVFHDAAALDAAVDMLDPQPP